LEVYGSLELVPCLVARLQQVVGVGEPPHHTGLLEKRFPATPFDAASPPQPETRSESPVRSALNLSADGCALQGCATAVLIFSGSGAPSSLRRSATCAPVRRFLLRPADSADRCHSSVRATDQQRRVLEGEWFAGGRILLTWLGPRRVRAGRQFIHRLHLRGPVGAYAGLYA
jgi:hypothetical protein